MIAFAGHDAYLATRPAAQQVALSDLRTRIARIIPQAEEVISYAMPGFRLGRRVIAGYAGFARNCGYYPHSGKILPQFAAELTAAGFRVTPGALQVTPDHPIPDDLLARLIAARLAEADAHP